MASLHSLLYLLGLLALAHSFCKVKRNELVEVDGQFPLPKECLDFEDKEHPMNSAWRWECMDCQCSLSGVSCCSRYHKLRAPKGCKVILDKETCKQSVVLESDEDEPCKG